MKSKLFSVIALLIVLVGCNRQRYQDISSSISSQQISVPKGDYKSIAWFDQDHIAFIYRPSEASPNEMNDGFRIGIFQISTGTTKDLESLTLALDCFTKHSEIFDLSRLPDNSLGFISHCIEINYNLYILDPVSKKITKRQTYTNFIAKSFSFSPDMSHLVQENGNGGGLSEELLLVSSGQNTKELLPDFQRARSPAWSSDGKTIAFAGTKDNPENKEITSKQDIGTLFLYPWDIYLMNADGSNPRILLPLAGTIYGLQWSPTNQNLLLFGGTSFDKVDGVWLLDISNMSIRRIWNKNTLFDWSPDGSKIVLLDDVAGEWWRNIIIIDSMK